MGQVLFRKEVSVRCERVHAVGLVASEPPGKTTPYSWDLPLWGRVRMHYSCWGRCVWDNRGEWGPTGHPGIPAPPSTNEPGSPPTGLTDTFSSTFHFPSSDLLANTRQTHVNPGRGGQKEIPLIREKGAIMYDKGVESKQLFEHGP